MMTRVTNSQANIRAAMLKFCSAEFEEFTQRGNNGGSVLSFLEEVIRVGHAMGFSMEGCEKDIEAIIEKQGVEAGNSGGILCIWEATVFKKDHVTISDNFVAIYGTWIPNNVKVLMVVVYAPQQPLNRRLLWEYLSILLTRWNGEAIIMGDFNDVRNREERRGSWFNPSSARSFDQFILSSGLVDVKMEGYAFTWSHPSATKMSKLDRFLVSEGIISLFPSITSVCLDRHLSDHRPILLRELKLDFGPSPFRFYHSWFSYAGFDEMVEQTWRAFSHSDRNVRSEWGSDVLLFKRHDLIRKLNDIKEMEGKDSIQKSKVRWAIEGDENSKYFHGIINKKRSQLAIRGVFVDGDWITDPRLVKQAFLDHYEARFKKPSTSRPKINFLFPNRLSSDQVSDLERGVSREEIRRAVWGCGENKSPGPDGFTFEFFKKYWEIVGPDLCEAVEHFFENGTFSKGCNSSFIALIPKVVDAKFVNDFRPISLIGSVYKVASVLVNGSPSDEFQFFCGLKQGDPLSPYLFILVMESLHLVVTNAVSNGMFKGIRLHNSLSISHLFYADDALFIGEWSDLNVKGIINILKCFFLASGLQINIHKSQLLGVGVPRSTVEAVAASMGCSVMEHNFRYLGVRVGENMSRLKAWDDVVLKLRSRLSKWKAKTLSIGGRLTLLKSVLGAAPLYTMSIYKVPKGVLKLRSKGFRGVPSFLALNLALILKWYGGFVSQDGSLWFRVIQALYGVSIDRHSSLKTSVWSSILKEVRVLKDKGFDFLSFCSKRIGDGNTTRFWLDIWKGDKVFRDIYPRVFSLVSNPNITVAEVMGVSLGESLRRPVRGGAEEQQFAELALVLDSVVCSSLHDRWVCTMSSDGNFRVKDVRISIDEIFLPSHTESTSWVRYVPNKVNIFAWRARRDCLPTRVNLINRGVTLESSSCPMCRSSVEDVHHEFKSSNLDDDVMITKVVGLQ
ncbi:RNA-directed DNA polymerase, eukaryota [Tanacetum coccineum]